MEHSSVTLSQSEWRVMEALWAGPKTLMELVRELGASAGWAKSTVTTMVRRMEEKGLIERRSQDGDRRSLYVYLTAEGWEKQKLVRDAMERMEQQVLDSLDQSQRDALEAGLLQVCLSLTEDKEALQ